MDLQEVFTKGLEHLRKQRSPAYERGECRYRARNGNRCFIGGVIPDDKYDPMMEGTSAQHPLVHRSFAFDGDILVLHQMQLSLHDDIMEQIEFNEGLRPLFMVMVEENAKTFAIKHGLKYEEPA